MVLCRVSDVSQEEEQELEICIIVCWMFRSKIHKTMRLQGHQQHNNNYKSASISTEQDYAELCAALRHVHHCTAF